MKKTISLDSLPAIALVGRVNVGKSTLFNHITDSGHAIVSKVPGTTRTRNVGVGRWRGKLFRVIDTGGLTFDSKDIYEKDIESQFDKALEESVLVIFLVDVNAVPTVAERALAKKLRQTNIPTIFIANKSDNNEFAAKAEDPKWRAFGLGTPTPISASTGRGVGDLLDTIISHPDFQGLELGKKDVLIPKDAVKVALLGKPNVGKSSLFNALINEDRVVVSEIAHTTRETHDTLFTYKDKNYLFVDTAGIRKKRKIDDDLEQTGVYQSLNSIEAADINLFVIDSSIPLTHQDKALAGLIEDKHRPLIIIANKWDLIESNMAHLPAHVQKEKDPETRFRSYLEHHFKYVGFAPILFVSAKFKFNITDIFPVIDEVNAARQLQVDPHLLEDAFRKMIRHHLPTKGKGVRHPKIYSIKQIAIAPPVFEVAVRRKTDLHQSYLRYLEKQLRATFGFTGVPMVFYVKKVMV